MFYPTEENVPAEANTLPRTIARIKEQVQLRFQQAIAKVYSPEESKSILEDLAKKIIEEEKANLEFMIAQGLLQGMPTIEVTQDPKHPARFHIQGVWKLTGVTDFNLKGPFPVSGQFEAEQSP